MTKPGRYFRTIWHLKPRQLLYQVWNRLRGRPRLHWSASTRRGNVPRVVFPVTFTLLNQPVTFTDRIDWNYAANGKLWTYTLNYFDGLTPSPENGLALLHDYIRQSANLRDGLEPYPTSMRLLNWRTFLLREGIQDPVIERHLYAQTALLRSRLEYHLGGNHLLENACALTVMAVHFRNTVWFWEGTNLLQAQLDEQILADGGHYERSPVYHQVLTNRLLDLYDVLHTDRWTTDSALTRVVRKKTAAMLNWLVSVTFRNGSVPMVNDAPSGVAPTTAELVKKATRLGFRPTPILLSDSGYRMLTTPRLELFIDVGPVGPAHQPGHAHADTLSFVLHIDGRPVVVDPGTSTYEVGERRSWERSTAAHNTVTVGGENSSEVWGGFRVGQRAQVRIRIDTPRCVEATHDGYARLGEQHTRRWTLVSDTVVSVQDEFASTALLKTCAFYFDHSVYLLVNQNRIQAEGVDIQFPNNDALTINTMSYELSLGFNRTTPAPGITIDFPRVLTTDFTAPL